MKRKLLVFWLRSVQNCTLRKKDPRSCLFLRLLKPVSSGAGNAAKKGETWSKAREINLRAERRIPETRCHLVGALRRFSRKPGCCFAP